MDDDDLVNSYINPQAAPASQPAAPPAQWSQAFQSQESSNDPNVGVSSAGAVGLRQILPETFAQYARPGEKIDNAADNKVVGDRILADYYQKYNGDAARAAVAYYSGPNNVAPAGSPTPWIKDISKDKNGNPIKPVSSYVSDITGKVVGGASSTSDDALVNSYIQHTPAGDVEIGPEGIPRITIHPTPTAGIMGAIQQGMPIVGPVMQGLEAATGAAIQPYLPGYKGPPDFASRFIQNYSGANLADLQFAQQHPVRAGVGNLIGAGAITAPAAATSLGGKLLGTTATSLGPYLPGVAGGVVGGADAALRGENPETGAAIGAGAGFLGPLVGEGIGALTTAGRNAVRGGAGVLAGMSPVTRGWLTNALANETPASLSAAVQRMGPEGFYGDINPATTSLTGGMATRQEAPASSQIAEAYRTREAGLPQVLDQAVTKATGTPSTNVEQFKNFITENRKAAADPLYEQWRNTQVHPTPELKALIPRLESAGAFGEAQSLGAIEGKPVKQTFFTTGAQKEFPTTETWDLVKRGLDSKIEQAFAGGNNTRARALVSLKNEMISEIEKTGAGQIWKAARQEFASRSALLDQIKAGEDTFLGGRSGLSPDELREELKGLGGPELQARIVGLRGAVDRIMGDTARGDTTLLNKLLAPNNQKKMAMLLGQDRADYLTQTAQQAKYLQGQSRFVNPMAGSATEPRGVAAKALEAPELPPWKLNLTEPTSYLPPSVMDRLNPKTLWMGGRQAGYAQARQQLAGPLLTRGRPAINALVQSIQEEMANRNAAAATGSLVRRATTGAIAGPGSQLLRLNRPNYPGNALSSPAY